jgi:hypothetical protein
MITGFTCKKRLPDMQKVRQIDCNWDMSQKGISLFVGFSDF